MRSTSRRPADGAARACRGSPNMAVTAMPHCMAGVALLAVMAHPEVDPTRTVSNHLIEIIDVLGIEAARNALMKV
jgi:hypothetical protein